MVEDVRVYQTPRALILEFDRLAFINRLHQNTLWHGDLLGLLFLKMNSNTSPGVHECQRCTPNQSK